jgi:protein-L-isoaspartate(D-aspartate) O-methyltransferase
MDRRTSQREMLNDQLRRRGVRDPAVLAAMASVPREAFVPEEMRHLAYHDGPLPIGEGQTISQPFIVAHMIELLALSPEDRVLEVGTGSGYGAAILSRIVATVYTLERVASLAAAARERLSRLGYDNVSVLVGDGTLGWPDHAPYDAIVVTDGAPRVPEPLKEQLAAGGRLVLPVGSTPEMQVLVRIRRVAGDRFEEEYLEPVRFVPLIGEAAWQ